MFASDITGLKLYTDILQFYMPDPYAVGSLRVSKKAGVEIGLNKVNSYDQARNKAFDQIGSLGPDSKPYYGSLKSNAGYGKIVGRQPADGKVRWRLDYDPDKGTHINVEDFSNGKGANAIKVYIPFAGDEKTFISLLNHLNK